MIVVVDRQTDHVNVLASVAGRLTTSMLSFVSAQ